MRDSGLNCPTPSIVLFVLETHMNEPEYFTQVQYCKELHCFNVSQTDTLIETLPHGKIAHYNGNSAIWKKVWWIQAHYAHEAMAATSSPLRDEEVVGGGSGGGNGSGCGGGGGGGS